MPGGTRVYLESSSEHIPEIERQILGERKSIRSIRHSLSFNKVSKLFQIHLEFQAIKMMNQFPLKGGIFDTIAPTAIMIVVIFHYKNHIGIPIGKYCKVHKEDTPFNSTHRSTKGAICMGPIGDI